MQGSAQFLALLRSRPWSSTRFDSPCATRSRSDNNERRNEGTRVARIDVVMPQMGESIAEGTLSRWLKKVGDEVKRDEPIFEISTDKVDAEIPAPSNGVLAEILVTEGQTVPVQTIVARLETEKGAAVGGGSVPPPVATTASAPKPSPSATPVAA